MSKNKFQISIANPCSENWELMTPTEKGRFCGSCQKAVVDFTEMTEKEIANVIKYSIGELCGRITTLQQEKVYNLPETTILGYIFSHSIFRNVALISGLALLGSKEAFAQNNIKKIKNNNFYKSTNEIKQDILNPENNNNLPEFFFNGKFVDEVNMGIEVSNSTIIFEGKKYKLNVDKDGKFSFKIPKGYSSCNYINYEIDVFGYDKVHYVLFKNNFNNEQNIPLNISCNVIGYGVMGKIGITGSISVRALNNFIGPPEYKE